MASTYSAILRLTYPTTGDLVGTWGGTVNTGITALIEDAIAGLSTIGMTDADYTLTANNGTSDEARKAALKLTGTLTAARNVVVPTVTKIYIVSNSTTGGFAVTVKTAAGSGVSVPNGSTYIVRCDGTNVVAAFDYQQPLVSGTNIKTVNGNNLLGSGDVTIAVPSYNTFIASYVYVATMGGINSGNA